MQKSRGRHILGQVIRAAFNKKEDKIIKIPAMLGRYNETGQPEIEVVDHSDFVWVRLRGQTSEVVRAFNEKIGFSFGTAILVTRDALDPRYYRVTGRDTGKYQDWGEVDGGNFTVLPHGHQHSFGDPESSGNDPVFVFKRQLAQPMLCHPQSPPDMTVYVEADYYFWANEFRYWAGGTSPSLLAYLPPAGMSRYVTVYFNANLGSIGLQVGTAFSPIYVGPDTIDYIPEISPSQGMPLAAVFLQPTTVEINWANLFDLRIMLFTGYGAVPGPHGLDPDFGSHTGQLKASHVDVADTGGFFTGTTVEAVLAELYTSGSGSLLERVWKGE